MACVGIMDCYAVDAGSPAMPSGCADIIDCDATDAGSSAASPGAADAICAVDATCFAEITPDGAFIITTAAQLADIQRLGGDYLKAAYVLGGDIILPPGWIPIGSSSSDSAFSDSAFRGSFDGKGHTIHGLAIENKPWAAQGLFGRLDGAVICDLVLEDGRISLVGGTNTGLLAGEAHNSSITDVRVSGRIGTGRISGYGVAESAAYTTDAIGDMDTIGAIGGLISDMTTTDAIGGLVGRMHKCVVERVFADVEISTGNYVGGVVGFSADTDFSYITTGDRPLTGRIAGGFAGRMEGAGLVHECHAKAAVSGCIVGGLVGQISGNPLANNTNHLLEIVQCSASGKVVAADIAGGFVGDGEYVLVKDSYAQGDVQGDVISGGFVGRLSSRSRVAYSHALGDVVLVVSGAAGGFVGEITNASCIEFAYSAGSVMAEDYVEAFHGLGYGNAGNGKNTNNNTDAKYASGALGGFAGVITASDAPNTLTHCLSFAPWVVGPGEYYVNRFAGRIDHNGINGCYAHLGSMVVQGGILAHVLPSAYGPDGADMSSEQVEGVAERLGWKQSIYVNNIASP